MPILPKTHIITFGNQKGGVGKTTSVINTAAALAMDGADVLVIDADPQGNSSTILLQEKELRDDHSLVSALDAVSERLPLSSRACRTSHPTLKIIPNSSKCMLWERKVANTTLAMIGLREMIERDQGLTEYDYILIDTPPTLGVMMNNALMASDFVVVPVPPSDQFAMDGLVTFFNLVQNIRRHHSGLKLLGILFTKYNSDWGESKTNIKKLRNRFAQIGINFFPTTIHACPEVDHANMVRHSLFETDVLSLCAEEYRRFAAEIKSIIIQHAEKTTT